MKKFILGLFAIAMLAFLPSYGMKAQASMLNLEPLARCCLPEKGRMQKNESDACHCPPERLCPVDLKEWREAKLLPNSIAAVCCPMPAACSIMRTQTLACGNGTTGITEDRTVQMCFAHNVQPASSEMSNRLYTTSKTTIDSFDIRLQAIREDIRAISRQPPSDFNYKKGNDLLDEAARIEAQINKIVDDANRADSRLKLTVTCQANTETKCCTTNLVEKCPPTDEKKKCQFWNHEVGDQGSKGWWYMTDAEKEVAIKKCPDYEFVDCVAEGTKVLMADGSQRAIQDVRIGDYVKGFNANNRVTGISLEEEGASFLMSLNDGKLNITPQHPIMTTKGWKAIHPEKVMADASFKATIGKLAVGDEIHIPDEGVIIVTKIGNYEGPRVPTYNLSVNGDRTFIANGMVIHAFKKNDQY